MESNELGRPALGTVVVRDALHEDIPGICATMPDAYGLRGGPVWQDPDYVAAGLASCAKGLSGREKIKVALMNEAVVGASFSRLALGPDGATAHTEIGVVHGIAVRAESRRQGVATALLMACEEYLSQERARVLVAEVRPRAVAFFSTYGYVPASGQALVIPSSAGTYVHPQTVYSTTLMWKSCRAEGAVVAEATARGTALAGTLGE
ncbi:GNAT family N-acetyltransferase [Streptomyces scabiei]|uniref:GNAT family N-acetyltransferase n=1 Tax=Streptomyces scabiei TaxID=1930 RepID=UPI0033D67779